MIKETIVLIALAAGQIPTVTDGDTVRIAGVSIRLTDYDSPELFSPKRSREYQLAQQASLELARSSTRSGWSWCRARRRIMDVFVRKARSTANRSPSSSCSRLSNDSFVSRL